jgi:hypothetical protein
VRPATHEGFIKETSRSWVRTHGLREVSWKKH